MSDIGHHTLLLPVILLILHLCQTFVFIPYISIFEYVCVSTSVEAHIVNKLSHFVCKIENISLWTSIVLFGLHVQYTTWKTYLSWTGFKKVWVIRPTLSFSTQFLRTKTIETIRASFCLKSILAKKHSAWKI